MFVDHIYIHTYIHRRDNYHPYKKCLFIFAQKEIKILKLD